MDGIRVRASRGSPHRAMKNLRRQSEKSISRHLLRCKGSSLTKAIFRPRVHSPGATCSSTPAMAIPIWVVCGIAILVVFFEVVEFELILRSSLEDWN